MDEELLLEVENMLDYLPIEEADIGISDYISKIYSTITKNITNEEYQVAYFNVHLIFMTYIYITVWKISKISYARFMDIVTFIRPYNGSKIDFENINSVFDYSKIPDKEIIKILKLINIENNINELMDMRDKMAHATGEILVNNSDDFKIYFEKYLKYIYLIHIKLTDLIRNWYEENIILKYYETKNLDEVIDVLIGLSFSKKEIEECSSFGVSKYKNKEVYSFNVQQLKNIREIKLGLQKYCKERFDCIEENEIEVNLMTAKEIKRSMFAIIKGILEGENVPNCEDLGIEQDRYFEIVSLMKNEGLLNPRLVSLDLNGNANIIKRIDAVTLHGIKFMEENEPLTKIYNSVKEIKSFVFGK